MANQYKNASNPQNAEAFVRFFRRASPYINAHRGKTFVIGFAGEAVLAEGFVELVHDFALLNSLGIRLVLVHGARAQIDSRIKQAHIELSPVASTERRITEPNVMPLVKEAIGGVRVRIESLLSMGLVDSPMHGARLRVSSGNVVVAQPIGVRDGVDYGYSGLVRRIDHYAISQWLKDGSVALLSPLGYSATGEAFNLRADEVATAAAIALRADKLILLYEHEDLENEEQKMIHQLDLAAARHLRESQSLNELLRARLNHALQACSGGVRRVHLLRRSLPGGLLLELFTRDGVGTLVSADGYDDLRAATIADIVGISDLVRPLEAEGVLIRRPREMLEIEIGNYSVLDRDGRIIACVALHTFEKERLGELACLVVAQEYRNRGYADKLLAFTESRARKRGLSRIFVLTTHTSHWFQERGFVAGGLADLPIVRQRQYNNDRKSKVFFKML